MTKLVYIGHHLYHKAQVNTCIKNMFWKFWTTTFQGSKHWFRQKKITPNTFISLSVSSKNLVAVYMHKYYNLTYGQFEIILFCFWHTSAT